MDEITWTDTEEIGFRLLDDQQVPAVDLLGAADDGAIGGDPHVIAQNHVARARRDVIEAADRTIAANLHASAAADIAATFSDA